MLFLETIFEIYECSVVVLDSYLLENSNFWNGMIFGLYCTFEVYDFFGNQTNQKGFQPHGLWLTWIACNSINKKKGLNCMRFNSIK